MLEVGRQTIFILGAIPTCFSNGIILPFITKLSLIGRVYATAKSNVYGFSSVIIVLISGRNIFFNKFTIIFKCTIENLSLVICTVKKKH